MNVALIQFKNGIRDILADYDSTKEEKYLQILGALKEYEKAKGGSNCLLKSNKIKRNRLNQKKWREKKDERL